MGQSTQIMGSSFRRGLHSEVSTFLTRLAIQPLPLYQINGEKARWQPPIFVSCLLIGPNRFTPLFKTSSMSQYSVIHLRLPSNWIFNAD